MRHGTSGRRQRNRNNNNNGRRNNQPRTQVYDSNGPDVRIRGNAHQVAEKYLALAKDATSAGDIIIAENYYQHAEHYIRIINENDGKFDAEKVMGTRSQDLSDQHGNSNQSANDDEDDLALPTTILGPQVSVANKQEEPVD